MFWIIIISVSSCELLGMSSAKLWSMHKHPIYLFLTALFFTFTGLLFAFSLKYEGMAIANVAWAALAIILGSVVGLVIFKEEISYIQAIGIVACILGLIFVNWPTK